MLCGHFRSSSALSSCRGTCSIWYPGSCSRSCTARSAGASHPALASRASITTCLAAAADATADQEHQAASSSPPVDQDVQPSVYITAAPRQTGAAREAATVLRALCHYAPMELSDGPASLSKIRPYNSPEVQAALQHAMQQQLLSKLDLQQLSNMAGALAAAGHLDHAFMAQLGETAAAAVKAQPRLLQHTHAMCAFRSLCWLAVGFSRLGVLHAGLMEQIAVFATHLLQRCPLQFSKRKHGQQLALLVGAFAALKLYPPQLFRAVCEHLKQHRQVIKLLGPQESMMLLWALARVGHNDPPALLWITQRAATQVGQLTCQGLAHAYNQCASTGITSAPLLAALRKACRVKLGSMEPADLTAILTALATLGQQDLLYLDEISRAVYNQLANFTAAEISSTLAALAALRYRNPWLLDQASKMMVSRKLQKAAQLTPDQLATLLESFHQLAYTNPLLLGHLGAVAAEGRVSSCTPAQLAAVVVGYQRLGFHQPQLLLAAATRLLQLSTALPAGQPAAAAAEQQQGSEAGPGGSVGRNEQQQQQCHQLGHLVEAALHLALMPSAAGSSAERAVLPAALLGLAAHALSLCTQQQHLQQQQPQQHRHGLKLSLSLTNSSSRGLQVMLLLRVALLLCVSTHCVPSPTGSAAATAAGDAAAEPGSSQQQHPAAPATADAASAAAAVGAAIANLGSVQQQALLRLSEVTQQLDVLQQQVQRELQQQLVTAVGADAAAAEQGLGTRPGLLCCMQLLWLSEQSVSAVSADALAPADNQHEPDHQAAAGSGAAAAVGGLTSSSEQQQPQQQQAEMQRQSWRLGWPELVTDALVQQQRQQLNQQRQLERQGGNRPVLHAVASAVSRLLQTTAVAAQQQQLEVPHVRVMYALPGSPIILPVAVLPAAASIGGDAANCIASTPQQRPHAAGTAGVLLCVQIALQQRGKVKLPADAQQLLTAAQHSQKPVAVIVDSARASAAAIEPAAYWPWYTCNAPEQLLPVAQVWQQGLCAAGWDVLVLQNARDDAEDREL